VKLVVLTTSYPRGPDDVAGSFVRDGVEAVRAEGLDVRVVSPASFRHFGIAYGDGIVNNLRRAPWKVLLLPLFLLSFALAARRASRGADVVHAHWLPSALPALATGKPFVLQLWGSDVAVAQRVRPLARRLVRRAQIVVCASNALADEARRLGARDVRVIPSPVTIPETLAEPDEPPHALYVGRLSEEKGIPELLAATEGVPRVIVGDGPLRAALQGRTGLQLAGRVPHADVPNWIAAADVVCQPSLVEPFGLATLEAMAAGRSVVATAIGGPPEFVPPEAGVLVDPTDEAALAQALSRAAALPRPNFAAREAAETHDVKLQAERVEAILLRAAEGRRA